MCCYHWYGIARWRWCCIDGRRWWPGFTLFLDRSSPDVAAITDLFTHSDPYRDDYTYPKITHAHAHIHRDPDSGYYAYIYAFPSWFDSDRPPGGST
ncbi:MAG: hypothetical protein ACP5GX_03035 [Anaerolineae bacterium]